MVDFTSHLGSISRSETFQKGLISDGHTMALFFGNSYIVLPGFSLSALSMSEDIHPGSICSTTIEFSVNCRQPLRTYNAAEVQDIFLNANNLSVDELLKLVYQRMEQRPS